MREVTDKMRLAAKKYITTQWREKYGFLEPFDIDEEKIQETSGGIYLKCICHNLEQFFEVSRILDIQKQNF